MKNILDTIGNTPLVKIEKINPNPKVNIFAKLEGFNPTGSVKDRIALAMIKKAEKLGILTKDKTILEPTSGNTGISLAMIAAQKGYRIKIIMSESMSIERRKILKAFGAEVILVKENDWRDAAIKFTKDLVKKNKNLILLNQFENGENIKAHYETTGKEILEQMEGKKIDVFVAGIGTGGTITGIGRRLKERHPDIKIIAIEPRSNTKIEGLRSPKKYLPPILNLKEINQRIIIKDKDAFSMTREIIKKEGIFIGISSGAAMYGAIQKARKISSGNIVVIFPDRGEKYLSTKLF
ncbi:cysteine synthase [Parcubacteria bacterium DG_74_2]|nr:MAG: cysteine synthase [Parcubacteria bacterium DG_74_2]